MSVGEIMVVDCDTGELRCDVKTSGQCVDERNLHLFSKTICLFSSFCAARHNCLQSPAPDMAGDSHQLELEAFLQMFKK